MTRPETERLRTRIRQLRHAFVPSEGQPGTPPWPADIGEAELVRDLRTRLAHLEALVQGLQDAVYRESQRQDKRVTELEARTDPAALAAALSEDARQRGL
jgi:hypothetical protein